MSTLRQSIPPCAGKCRASR